jgi:hypothetical protein
MIVRLTDTAIASLAVSQGKREALFMDAGQRA